MLGGCGPPGNSAFDLAALAAAVILRRLSSASPQEIVVCTIGSAGPREKFPRRLWLSSPARKTSTRPKNFPRHNCSKQCQSWLLSSCRQHRQHRYLWSAHHTSSFCIIRSVHFLSLPPRCKAANSICQIMTCPKELLTQNCIQ